MTLLLASFRYADYAAVVAVVVLAAFLAARHLRSRGGSPSPSPAPVAAESSD